MKRTTLLTVLMVVVAVLVPAAAASAVHTATDGGASTEYDISQAQLWKAEMIASQFAEEGSEEGAIALVVELRTAEPAMGWGVLSKLVAYAVASDMSFEEFLAAAQNEDGGYSMGHLRKEYLADPDRGELPYPNFGQMQQAERATPPGQAKKATPPGQAKKATPPGQAKKAQG
jgi:hypothetical protein